MNITTDYNSSLVLKNIMITEGDFKRVEDSLNDIDLGIKVSHDIEHISDNGYKVVIELVVSDEEQKMYVHVKCVAWFETKQDNQNLIERNTIAIMFPYLRSYVSTLTTQPGMTPIVLPAMNIVSMLSKNE